MLGVRCVSNKTMFILFFVISLLLGIGIHHIVLLVARSVDDKIKACTYSCLLGMALIMALMIVAYLVIPTISHTIGSPTSHIGVIV
jgi:hypothetical protein